MRLEVPEAPEEWRPVLGYEGLYEISNMGRVRALFCTSNFHKHGRILKPWILKNGYVQIHLMRPGEKRKAFCIHRLLLEAFAGPAPENCEVRHLNGVRSDNALKNLAWGTHKENSQDMLRHGHGQTGEKQWNAKLTSDDVIQIRTLRNSGMSLIEIAELYGIDRTNVWQIATRKSWRHI